MRGITQMLMHFYRLARIAHLPGYGGQLSHLAPLPIHRFAEALHGGRALSGSIPLIP